MEQRLTNVLLLRGNHEDEFVSYIDLMLVVDRLEELDTDFSSHTDTTRHAYYKDDTALVAEGLDSKTLADGSYTVRACTHSCKYTHTNGTTAHSQICPACGDTKTSETCSYVDGKCACGSTLSVALTGTEKLVYDGNPHTPGVTVTLDGTEITAANYDVTYGNNIKAGTDTATVTVKGKGNYSFESEKTFTIEKAEQKDFAATAVTRQYEKNGTFAWEKQIQPQMCLLK